MITQAEQIEKNYSEILLTGLTELNLLLDHKKIELLLAYHQLLIKWNKAYNLTAVRDPEKMIARHFLDCLSLVPFLEGKRFIDIGTGAGFPGIVLAIVFPESQFDLLDSNGKKTRFLFQVKTELKLKNIEIHQCRVEQYHPVHQYDGVLSRAFSVLADMINGSGHLLKNDGKFYAMKGVYPHQEITQINAAYNVIACHLLLIPNEDTERHLVVIAKSKSLNIENKH